MDLSSAETHWWFLQSISKSLIWYQEKESNQSFDVHWTPKTTSVCKESSVYEVCLINTQSKQKVYFKIAVISFGNGELPRILEIIKAEDEERTKYSILDPVDFEKLELPLEYPTDRPKVNVFFISDAEDKKRVFIQLKGRDELPIGLHFIEELLAAQKLFDSKATLANELDRLKKMRYFASLQKTVSEAQDELNRVLQS